MDELTCPQCQGTMAVRTFGHVSVRRCTDCSGIFLSRADLGALVEAENDWHEFQSPNTAMSRSIPPTRRPRIVGIPVFFHSTSGASSATASAARSSSKSEKNRRTTEISGFMTRGYRPV